MRRSFLIVPVLLLAACGGDQGPHTPAAIVLTPNAPRVPAGGTLQLTAAVVDDEGRALPDEPIVFESSEPTVVTVSDEGLLTSVGPLGSATITAGSGAFTAEVEADVVPPPSSLFVSPLSLTLPVNETFQLYIIVTDEHGDSIPDAELAVHTDNTAVISVGVDGNVWAKESGLATITVVNGDRRRDVHVTVTAAESIGGRTP
jgi:uncharacterized protein YjdB